MVFAYFLIILTIAHLARMGTSVNLLSCVSQLSTTITKSNPWSLKITLRQGPAEGVVPVLTPRKADLP